MVDQAVRHLDPSRLQAFRDRFAGDVVLPGDETYDASRAVWNGMIDRRPALILRPTSADEVAAALRFGRDEDLPIAVRSGGHSLPGHSTCDDGVIIDLARMRGVTVDPERRVARCNGGARLAELDDAAQAVGLACTAGTVSHTGIAGLTLGGGMGRLQRKLGLAIDCLRAVELVTADGRHVRASADEHAGPVLGHARRGPQLRDRDRARVRPGAHRTRDLPRPPRVPGRSRPTTSSAPSASSPRPPPTTPSCR